MKHSELLLLAAMGCAAAPTETTGEPLQVTVERSANVLTVANTGRYSATVTAVDKASLSVILLAPCEAWTPLAPGASVTLPIAEVASEMLVMYCVFPSPPPAKPTANAAITVRVR